MGDVARLIELVVERLPLDRDLNDPAREPRGEGDNPGPPTIEGDTISGRQAVEAGDLVDVCVGLSLRRLENIPRYIPKEPRPKTQCLGTRQRESGRAVPFRISQV